MTIGCGLVTSFLLYTHKLESGDYANIIMATVAVYIAGNTFQKTKVGTDD